MSGPLFHVGAMPGILTNNGLDDILVRPGTFDPNNGNQWEWQVDDHSPDDDAISQEDGQAFMIGHLKEPSLLIDAVSYFVGWSRLSPSPNKVIRWNPNAHPRWPYMRCSGVSVKGLLFHGQERTLSNLPGRKQKNPVYKRYQFDIRYKQWDFDFREDSEVATEWERCLKVDPYDLGEIITVDGGQYRYESQTTPQINGKPVVINGPSLRLDAQRQGLRVTSWGLPAQFVLDNYGIANNFLKAKGKVNSTTFLNRPAGTMLLQNWNIEKRVQPVKTKLMGALAFNAVITMDFAYTDPPRAEPNNTLRGWQLLPAVGGIGQGAGGNGTWYPVRTDPAFGSQPLYDSYDMNKLLQYRDDS